MHACMRKATEKQGCSAHAPAGPEPGEEDCRRKAPHDEPHSDLQAVGPNACIAGLRERAIDEDHQHQRRHLQAASMHERHA
jgi:hypothetical protein